MNLSKYKRWKRLSYTVIAKQQAKREQIHRAVEKYEKVENINTQNDYKTTSEKWTDKKKTDSFFTFCKCV